jgi:alkanesulfonate monooxygenase SsuD/methylene tetrahydromethanopterin reductase-like flavin-dependent oxidoreductase (luciferase family)
MTGNPFREKNKLALGAFGINCSGAVSATTIPEAWDGSWEHNLQLAQMADAAGMDFMLPLGRWRGYGGKPDHNGHSFETLTWATGILASTQQIRVFSTVHVTLFHPVLAAKQMVTADHVGRGRFGLNIVCGWYIDEFQMFGVELGETNERRYEQGQEWMDIVNRVWTETEPFDFKGEFYNIRSVVGQPKPVQKPRPTVVNAGISGRGREFAMRNADLIFYAVVDTEKAKPELARLKKDITALGRDVGIFSNAFVVCRPTRKEAEEFYEHYAVENANNEAIETMMEGRGFYKMNLSEDVLARMRKRMAGGNGAFPIVGTPDDVADTMETLSNLGIDGLALGFVNGLEYFPYIRDEVFPRLEKKGLRSPAQT